MSLESVKKIASDEALPLHTVAAEIIQIAFLEALYSQKESTGIVFHGGTSIRLLHGGYRYSEDLDFAVPQLKHGELKRVVEIAAGKTKDLLITVIGRLDIELKARPARGKNVHTWWLNVIPEDYRGKIHVKLEFGHYPVHQPRPMAVTLRHPLINIQPITVSPSVDELFLDKINALAGRQFLKSRDIFDVWYLTTVLKPKIDYELLMIKFKDYRTERPIQTLKKRLADLKPQLVAETMERFLPVKYRRIFSLNKYREIIDANRILIGMLLQNLEKRGELK